MHMADALISPAVGGALWAGTALTATYAVRKVQHELEDKKIPLMGVMGAFVFAAQMINFTIPGTGSSGHIGGGMLLAILLGPFAGFLTLASVLVIQALFFADGGLLALGCNIMNMGFFTCFVAYPLIYRIMTRKNTSKRRLTLASVLSVVAALQIGAFAVVLETFISGRTELPLGTFVLFMQPIHLAIGLVEGLITAAVVVFLKEARPDLLQSDAAPKKMWPYKRVLAVLVALALLTGGILSWYASSHPDGLEWSIEKTAGSTELESSGSVHQALSEVQEKTALLPDYQLKESAEDISAQNAGTSISGIAGSVLTLGLVAVICLLILFFKKRREPHSRIM